MSRFRSAQVFAFVALCSSLGIAGSLPRCVRAAPRDVVELNGDTHHDPPASTTDKDTVAPATKTDSGTGNGIDKAAKDNRDAAKQQDAEKKLQLRAGERVGGSARGAAQVLGMSLQEGTHNRVKVVEVAMNSPAFDAGVMKGDEILAFQGFRGDSYRKWIDGIRRLTADTGAGLKIPVIVDRDGNQVSVRIEVPAKPVRSAPGTLAPGNPLIPPGVGPALPATESQPPAQVAVVNGGNNVAVENAPAGVAVGAAEASPNERATAQIVRIGGSPSANPGATPNSTEGATAAPVKGGAHIGMAGFHDEPSGMIVVVDVGALPQGSYTVAIADPSVVGGAAVTTPAATNPNVQSPTQPPAPGNRDIPNNNPLPGPKGASQPQGSLPPTSSGLIPRSVLAQVIPTTNTAAPQGTTGKVIDPPSQTGGVHPASAPPSAKPQNNAGGGAILNQIGTLTVDQSGTGRLRQKVESVQVRNVVGQAIVLYSQNGSAPNTTSNDVNRGGVLTQQQAAGGAQVPVAGGIIHLVTDRRPQAPTGPQAVQTPAAANGAVEQPASAAPPAGQNLVR